MFQYTLNAQAMWKEFGSDLKWKLGDKFKLTALFVNGEIVDTSIASTNDIANTAFAEKIPEVFQERVTSDFHSGRSMTMPEVLDEILINLFYSLVEDWQRRVFKLCLTIPRNSGGFLVHIYDAEDDEIISTKSSFYFKAIH